MKIESFNINNYRSLVNFKVESFDATTIFYGLNNAGKSNIISALETIFKRKVQFDRGEYSPVTNFYQGVLRDFTSNFFNQDESLKIEFEVVISANIKEFTLASEIASIFKSKQDFKITIAGEIVKSDIAEGAAEMITQIISIDKTKIYDINSKTGFYFPTLIDKTQTNVGRLAEIFSIFINPLNDCIYVIESARDMHPISMNYKEDGEITPKTFKKFLYALYLSEKNHLLFEEINEIFKAEPFGFGAISFSHINKDLEIMVKENSIRLPIKQLGSGVLQILYVITAIIFNKNKIICIEELEQNMSPKLQNDALSKVQSMIGKHTHQIIISSHSPVFYKEKYSKAIYLIEKQQGKTVIGVKLQSKLDAKAKKHFVQSTMPPETYTKEEYTKYLTEDIKKDVENRFNA